MTTTTAPPRGRMSLSNVHKGRRRAPDRIVLYGPEGVGKSTFAADAEAPIFIAAEDGIRELDVASFPEPKSIDEVFEALALLERESHEYKTVVIDTVDWLEPIVFQSVCNERNWNDIEAPGYGKGYTAAVDCWRKLLARLDGVRMNAGMGVVMLGHAHIKRFGNPLGDDYERYELAMNLKSAALIRQWSDVVLFANYEEWARKADKNAKAKGASTGRRLMHTVRTAAWDAKNRFGLPETMPLSWGDYHSARESGPGARIDELRETFAGLMAELGEHEKRGAIEAFVGDMKDADKLARTNDRIRELIDQKNKNTEGE